MFKKLLFVFVFTLLLFISGDKAYAVDSVCTDKYPGNPDKACCTNWGPPNLAICTNNTPICTECGSCGPKTCPDVGYGNTPGSYCKYQCVSCGVTSDWQYDNDCNCVKTGEFPTNSVACQGPNFCPPPATKPPTAPPTWPPTKAPTTPPNVPTSPPPPTQPPQTCPNNTCEPDETCSSCPGDCGQCIVPTQPPFTPGPTGTPIPTRTPAPTNTPGPTSTPRPTNTPAPSNTPRPTASVTPRPPTPTPDFNNAMCECDSISVTALASGRPFTVTAKGKVTGTNTSKAVLTGFVYRLFEGNTRLTETAPLPVTVTNASPTLVNYEGKWNYNMPSNVKKGVEYRIQAVNRCKPKATAMGGAYAVLGESTSQSTFLGDVTSFVKDLAYRIYSLPFRASRIASEKSLQLQTFNPMEITENNCTFIKFKVK